MDASYPYLAEINELLNKLKEQTDGTLLGIRSYLEDEEYDPEDFSDRELEDLMPGLQEAMISYNYYFKSGSTRLTAWDYLYKYMSQITYDNRLPLIGKNYPPENPTEEHNYFEHYDREQEFEEFFDEFEILYAFYNKDNEISFVIDWTPRELKSYCIREYGQSNYEHDFGQRPNNR